MNPRQRWSSHSVATWCVWGALGVLVLVGCERQIRLGADRGPESSAVDAAYAMPPVPAMPAAGETQFNTEAYDAIVENTFVEVLQQPQSTFAVDVDTAAYANVRRFLREGRLPPPGAVRLEELVNYFNYHYPEPQGKHPLAVSAEVTACPWASNHQLLRVGLLGRSSPSEHRPPANLVFLLDVSGSMMQANKLPLVQSAMQLLVQQLSAQDQIAIVTYAGSSGILLESTSADQIQRIRSAIDSLQASGSTNGGSGIQLAYQIAESQFVPGGINRVLLCTDGDFNVGTTSQSELVQLIEDKSAGNVFLTVLGFGTGNLKDATMELLADKGNGNYAYIDNALEARKVLVEELGATLETIAKDVKVQVDFNPQHVRAYRLLGYENRLLANQAFRDDLRDAGEMGAGHTVTAFYELVPAGQASSATSNRPSEFVTPALPENADSDTRLTLNVRYKQPEAQAAEEFQVRLPASDVAEQPSQDLQFAACVLAYGMLLRNSDYAGTADWPWVIENAEAAAASDSGGLRREFVELARLASRLQPKSAASQP